MVSVMNVLGKDVSTALNVLGTLSGVKRSLSEVEVDVSKLSPGIYFLQLKTATASYMKKFVKQ